MSVALFRVGSREPLVETERFLLRSLRVALAERRVACVALPAPDAPMHALLRGLFKGYSVSWAPPEGVPQVAHGAARIVRLSGGDRFEAMSRARHELLDGCLRLHHPAVSEAAPRLYGGWSFAEGSADREPWSGFGDGCFFLPRWTHEPSSGAAPGRLIAAVDLRDGNEARLRLAQAELRSVLEALEAPPRRDATNAPAVVREDAEDQVEWAARIQAILEAIRAGSLEKVVASRVHALHTDHDLDPWRVLEALHERYPDTWRFGLRLGGATLLAASPERLFVKQGRRVVSDALAGSIAANDPAAARLLRRSLKDLREHRPVVEHLTARLARLSTRVDPPGRPTVRRLPNVLHLHTPVSATLRADVEPEHVAAALHPTPAVGGVPALEALNWIGRHEPHQRGWYCGAVGWIDADGDAELAVTLRCGLLRGASAWLYGGGGIVEGSRAEAEWRETTWKLSPLSAAIGAAR